MADIPGVWSYLYKNDTNPGENFTRAYSAAKSAKNDEAALKQRADELANRRSEFEGEMGLRKSEFSQRQKEHQDRIDQDTQQRADRLAKEFGPSVVLGPDGKPDALASAKADALRIERDKMSEALGTQETLTGQINVDVDNELRNSSGYRQGKVKALLLKQQQDAINKRATESAQSRIDAAKIRSGNAATSPTGGTDAIVVQQGVPGVMSGKGNFKPLTGDALRAYRRANPSAGGGTNAPPKIRATVTFKPDGTPVITTPK